MPDQIIHDTGARISSSLELLDSVLGGATYFSLLFLAIGIFFTFYLRFPQLRFFRHALAVVRGRYTPWNAPGEATHAQSLAFALAGTIGASNIAGVAVSVHVGGPASILWMWVAAFFSMALQYSEVTLAHAYRRKDSDGRFVGGPMDYLERGAGKKWMAVSFAAALTIGALGSCAYSNHFMGSALESAFDARPLLTGILVTPLLALVIVGGVQRISLLATAIVPVMTISYLVGTAALLVNNYDQILPSFALIFRGAFSPSAAAGGFLGAALVHVVNRGVSWTLWSNEAGQGTTPNAHSLARTEEPVSQGVVSILGPFVDTFLISTATGLALLVTGVWNEKFPQVLPPQDTQVVVGSYSETDPSDVKALFEHLNVASKADDPVAPYSGELVFDAGTLTTSNVTLLLSRSIVEGVSATVGDGEPFSGSIEVAQGVIQPSKATLSGDALMESLGLTREAWDRGIISGGYLPLIVLTLFIFSTAVVWCYYGARATAYLFGDWAAGPFKIAYVAIFFLAVVADTTTLRTLAAVTTALAALVNLFGLLLLRREIKERTDDYSARLR